jgi:hypothetical protein
MESDGERIGPQRAAPKSPRQITASLKQFAEDLKEAHQQSPTRRHGVCSACNNVVTHEFLRLPNVQTVYLPCDCGERVMVRYFP